MILLFVIINNLIFLYAIGHRRRREQLLNRAAHCGASKILLLLDYSDPAGLGWRVPDEAESLH